MFKHKLPGAVVLVGLVLQSAGVCRQTPAPAVGAAPARVESAAGAGDAERRRETFEIVWRTVQESHFDPKFGGVDWDAVRAAFAPHAARARTDAELHGLLQQMLNRLGQSHFAIIPPEAIPAVPPEETDEEGAGEDDDTVADEDEDEAARRAGRRDLTERLTHGVGVDVRVIDGAVVITRVEPQSPAARAGLRPGFVLRGVDGQSMRRVLRVIGHFAVFQPALRHRAHEEIVVGHLNGPAGTSARVSYTDARGRLRRASLPRERLRGEMSPPFQAMPAQFYEFEARRLRHNIGYIRFDVFAAPVLDKFCAAVRSMSDAPGLVIDLRGNRGGLLGLIYGMAGLLVEGRASFGTMRMRAGSMEFRAFPQRRPYKGQVVVLIDGASVSASEIFAGGLQDMGRALVVGDKSAGMTLPSIARELPTGAILQYAFADFTSPRGQRLEGRGVTPDFTVRLDRRSLLAGRDAQLETALDSIDLSPITDPSPSPTARGNTGDEDEDPHAPVEVVARLDSAEDPPMPAAASPLDPEVERIVEKYERAVGGREAFERATSRVSRGTFQGTFADLKINGTVEILEKAPDSAVHVVEIPGYGLMRRGYNGAYGFEQVPLFGYREFRGHELAEIKLASDFRWGVRLRRLYQKMTLAGKERVGGSDAHVVEATPAAGLPVRLYFDAQTGLIVRKDDTYFEDYREVDGLRLPFVTRGPNSLITLNEVRHNLPLDDARFTELKDCFTQ